MMKLGIMQEVVATVNDHWESDLADRLLLHWEHDDERAKYWRASANFIFFFKREGKGYVLRFNHASERTAVAIQAEIDYVNILAEQGICVAKPVRSIAGNEVESVVTAHGIFHAVVFEALPGKQLELEDLTPEQFVCWGKTLGELHRATTHYANPNRPTWEDHLMWISESLPADEKAARQAFYGLKMQLGQLATNEQTFGLIHFDFELDNIIWDGEQPGIIDFDDSAAYWFVADIAFALRDLFEDSANKVNLQDESFLHFIQGYKIVRPIDPEELKLIPLFLRVHNLMALAKLYRVTTPTHPQGELPWMAELRSKLATKMQFYRDEFSV